MATGQLIQLSPEMWAIEGEAKLAPGFYFPVRCTIVRLSDGGLLLHSPIAFSDDALAAIRQLGEVRSIFAPNLFHNKFLAQAIAAFPGAEVVGPEGLSKKLKKVAVGREVGKEDVRPFGDDFLAIFVGGAPKFNEVVLHHTASQTLLVGDYFFNIQQAHGLLTNFLLKNVTGGFGRPMMSNLWRKAMRDQDAMKATAERLLSLDVGRIVVCHGEIIEQGGDVIRREVAWLTDSSS